MSAEEYNLAPAGQPNEEIIDPLAIAEGIAGEEIDVTPAEQVDDLLQASAEAFAESRSAWREVQATQNAYVEKMPEIGKTLAVLEVAPPKPGVHDTRPERKQH